MGMIIFNGQSSKDYHIQVEHPPGYDFPERDYETIHIPGRNGDLIIDNGCYKNVDRKYEISAGSHDRKFISMARDISVWLHSAPLYSRLEDSYEPDYYRLASYVESGEIENILCHGAKVEITFNCKPQRYLKSGERKKSVKSGGLIKNPTPFDSLPIILVTGGTGTGTIEFENTTATIKGSKSPLIINSEIQDVYEGDNNRNNDIELTNGFPILIPGNNRIRFSGSITALEVIPKWWTL